MENDTEKTKLISKACRAIKLRLYDIRVKLSGKKTGGIKSRSLSRKRLKDSVFYYGLLSVPLIMLVFNYVFINGNSLLLAFKDYDLETGKATFNNFGNFIQVINDVRYDSIMQTALKNGVIVYGVSLVVTTIVPVLFSYYIYKKCPLHGVFKVLLFLPSIISAIITVTIYKYLADVAIVDLMEKVFGRDVTGYLSDPNKTFNTVLLYYVWMQLGGGLLIQLGAMNTVDKEVTEAAVIDGIGFFGEFWHVVLPKIYQIISIGFILGIISILTNDMGLYAFYGTNADPRLYTVGYYFTILTIDGDLSSYPYLAAWGLLSTMLALPITFLARHLIYKYGPQE